MKRFTLVLAAVLMPLAPAAAAPRAPRIPAINAPMSPTVTVRLSPIVPKPDSANHYEILGVPVDASPREIKSAYQRLVMANHPDRNPDDPHAHRETQRINAAYHTLSNKPLRELYDALIDAGAFDTPSPSPRKKGRLEDTFYFDHAASAFVDDHTKLRFTYDPRIQEWVTPDGKYYFFANGSHGLIYDHANDRLFIPAFARHMHWRLNDSHAYYPGWIYTEQKERWGGPQKPSPLDSKALSVPQLARPDK